MSQSTYTASSCAIGIHLRGNGAILVTCQRVRDLAQLGENWNGYNVAAPRAESIEKTIDWLQSLDANTQWIMPHVSADEEGFVCFEWQTSKRCLTLYFETEHVSGIRAYQEPIPDMDTFDDIICETPLDLLVQLDWLMGNDGTHT